MGRKECTPTLFAASVMEAGLVKNSVRVHQSPCLLYIGRKECRGRYTLSCLCYNRQERVQRYTLFIQISWWGGEGVRKECIGGSAQCQIHSLVIQLSSEGTLVPLVNISEQQVSEVSFQSQVLVMESNDGQSVVEDESVMESLQFERSKSLKGNSMPGM